MPRVHLNTLHRIAAAGDPAEVVMVGYNSKCQCGHSATDHQNYTGHCQHPDCINADNGCGFHSDGDPLGWREASQAAMMPKVVLANLGSDNFPWYMPAIFARRDTDPKEIERKARNNGCMEVYQDSRGNLLREEVRIAGDDFESIDTVCYGIEVAHLGRYFGKDLAPPPRTPSGVSLPFHLR